MARDVGDYRVQELLGYGGAGEVWRGRRRGSDEDVALKWLRGSAPGPQERQLREARLLAAVSHPNLVQLREVVSDRGQAVLVLDYLPGGSLASLLARRGRLDPGEVVSIVSPLAAALAYAHDEGLVHADVTPANILFSARGRPVLTDLGVARVLGESIDAQATPEYVDPVVAGGSAPGPASDVFGLAAVAFHALAGVPPWNAATAADALAVAVSGELPDLRRLAPDAPAELVDVVVRALSAEPHLRGTAAELALDVRHACPPEAVRFGSGDAAGRVRGHGTGVLTHAVRVPRPAGAGPAHAAPPPPLGRLGRAVRAGLGRVVRAGLGRAVRAGLGRTVRAGLGRAVRAGLGRAVRAGRRRRRDVLAAAAVLLAVAAAALLGLRWGEEAGPPPAAGSTTAVPEAPMTPDPPSPDSATSGPATTDRAAAEPAGVDEYAEPAAPAGWLPLLGALYDRRAAAFESGDAERLAGVYASGSDQAAADRAEIERLAAGGRRVAGFDPHVVSIEAAGGHAPEVTLVVTDAFGPYTVVEAGLVVRAEAGRDAARVEVSLRLTAAGWRIGSAVRLAGAG